MIKTQVDWRYLRRPMLIALALLLLGAIPYTAALRHKSSWAAVTEKSLSELAQIQRQLRELHQSKKTLSNFYQRFLFYQDKGLISEADRLALMEEVKNAANAFKLKGMRLEIGPRQTENLELNVARNGVEIYATPMRVEIRALHEGDMFDLVDKLREEAIGLFSNKSCEWQRVRSTMATDGKEENMTSRCELLWYSLHTPALKLGEAQ